MRKRGMVIFLVMVAAALAHQASTEPQQNSASSFEELEGMRGGLGWICESTSKTCEQRLDDSLGGACVIRLWTECNGCNNGPVCRSGACTASKDLKKCVQQEDQSCSITSHNCGTAAAGVCTGIMINQINHPSCPEPGNMWTCQGTACNPTGGDPHACPNGTWCWISL